LKTAYFILGMHRSGTSALGGILFHFGLDFGSELTKPSAIENPKGFFENVYVQALDKKIFLESNSSWDDYTFNIEKIGIEKKNIYIQEAKTIIETEYRYADQFVIKDPRICLLFPLWEEACRELGIEIKIILPYRNPLEVAESLKKRNGFSYEKSLLIWSYHFLLAEKYSRKYERLFLFFDDLLDETKKSLERLEAFTGLTLNDIRLNEINDFLDKNTKHNNLRLENFTKEIPLFLQKIIRLLQNKTFEDSDELDLIQKDFYYALNLFQPIEIRNIMNAFPQLEKEVEANKKNIVHLQELQNQLSIKKQIVELQLKEQLDESNKYKEIINILQNEKENLNTIIEEMYNSLKDKNKEILNALHNNEEEKKALSNSLNIVQEEKNQKITQLEEELLIKDNKILDIKNIIVESLDNRKTLLCRYFEEEKKQRSNIQNFYRLKSKIDYKYKNANTLINFMPQLKVIKKIGKVQKNIQLINTKFSRIPLDFIAFFDEKNYLLQNADVKDAIENKKFTNALEHFIFFGFDEVFHGTRKLHHKLEFYSNENSNIEQFKLYLKECYLPLKVNLNEPYYKLNSYIYELETKDSNSIYTLIKKSKLFDEEYYLKHNGDIKKSKINPLKHYILHGEKENRQPNEFFNPALYIDRYLDVKQSGISPLYHYVKYGKNEGRIIEGKEVSKVRSRKEEFQSLQELMYEYEHYLINWEVEKRKVKNLNLVSIIMPVYGQAELTEQALNSLLKVNAGVEYELIIINNGQDKEDIKKLDVWKKYSHIKIIHNEKNLNFALACNLGFSRSLGSRVVFLNNDTTVTENWLFELIKPLENENISATQPRLLYPDGKLQCMGIVFSNKSQISYPIYQNRDIPKSILNTNRTFKAITAACIAVRAEDFSILHGFDIKFINGQEDVDFCLRLNTLKNSSCLYVANSLVYHYEGKSKGRGKFVPYNRMEFLKRWKGKIEADDLSYYAEDGYTVTEWVMDSNEMKKMNIEFYKPRLEYNKTIKSIPIKKSKYNFFIEGKRKFNKSKKTILLSAHAVGKMLFGGERSFLDMVQAIASTDYNLLITIPNANNEIYVEMLLEYSSCIYVIPYNFWNPKGTSRESVNLIENIIKNYQVDLVYVNTIVCKEPLEAGKIFNIPKIIHIRELIDRDVALQKTIGKKSPQILEELKESSDYIVANSKETLTLFENVENKGIIYNRIDTDYLDITNNVDAKKISFVMISSNIPKKGIYDFFEIAKACKNITNAQFVIVGPNNQYIKKMQQDVQELKMENIEFKGYIENSIEAIESGNVVLSLSHFAESFGRTVGEALAARRAVIAYEFGAIPELVIHEKNGYLAKYKNTDEVITYIEKLCNNPKLIQEFGEQGRKDIINISSTPIYNKNMNHILTQALSIDMKLNKQKEITIIVPIYNAYNEIINCLDSIMNTVSSLLLIEVLIINDGSSDERIKPLLEKYKQFTIVHNSQNMGYTKTINKAINLAEGKDIILLNSDTITTTGWIESLKSVAYSHEKIGTVTAMSDNAGAFSFPIQGKYNPKPKYMTYNNYAKLIIDQTAMCDIVEVTTGSGFCLYIKGKLIKEIGSFDEVLFPRGYGEENEFCLRAIRNGWKNVISPKTFIFHIRSASFGNEKSKLIEEGLAKVLERYPSYMQNVKKTFSSNSMKNLRAHAQKAVTMMGEEKDLIDG